jgi:HSP20 family protein
MTPFLETLGFTDERFMRVEEFEDAGTHVVRAEIPGVDPDKDVDIYFTDHTLRIEAKRQVEKQTKEKGGYRSEFRYGHYLRSVPLPMGADVNDVKATYKDGVLEVRVPVDHETAKQTKIPVQRL